MADLRDNALLSRLPQEEFSRISERAQTVESAVRECVQPADEPIGQVYFPLTSVFSMVAGEHHRENVIEVATIGREGMIGLPLFLGSVSSPLSVFCQIPGPSARLSATDLRRVLGDDGTLHRVLNRFTQATMVQIAQNVFCNAMHSAEQRASRWLLTTQDRVVGQEFPLTQEFLARMLGVRRPTVSEIAGRLQDRGLIRYRRGVVTITDQAGLERLACQCYEVVRAAFEDLTGS